VSHGPAPLPSFSVIVPTWNRPVELATCLRALVSLDYPADRYEVVVVDDGSDPPVEPPRDLARPGLRVRVLAQPNRGPSAARNEGARAAEGEMLAFTDDDCAPDPGWLRSLAAAAATAPRSLLGGRVVNGLPGNRCSVASQAIVDANVSHLFASGNALRFLTSNNLALSAEGFRAMGGFDERFRTAEDREFCYRWIAAARPVARVPDAVVEHRHDLTLATFWRQQFGYGRGAYRFQTKRAPSEPPLRLAVFAMHARAFRQGYEAMSLREILRVAPLLVVWQIANACGFAYQWAMDRRVRPR